MKLIRNELYDKYTKTVITYDTVFKELTRQDLMDIFYYHCANIRVLVEAVDYFYSLIQNNVEEKATPTLTEDEKVILRNIDKTYTHISRTYGDIWVGIGEETADTECKRVCVFNHLFQFIKERRRISNRGAAK